jgi:hypothetical protein
MDPLVALKKYADSAPRPDGIVYSIFKRLWSIVALKLNLWNYICNSGMLPASPSDSVITLLSKSEKDTKKINSWKPITL